MRRVWYYCISIYRISSTFSTTWYWSDIEASTSGSRVKKHSPEMDCPYDQALLNPSGDSIVDGEFRRTLWSIKQYIPYVNSNYQLSLYRSWLEKLSSASTEKIERNIYLLELARQIRNNTILPPFNQPPPPGSLKELPKINHFKSSNPDFPRHNLSWLDSEMSLPVAPYTDQNYYSPVQQHCQDVEKKLYFPYLPFQNKTTHSNCACYIEPLDNYYYNMRYEEDDDDDGTEIVDEKQKEKKKRPKSGLRSPVVSPKKGGSEESGEMSKDQEKNSIGESPSRDMPKNEAQIPATENDSKLNIDDSSWYDLTDTSITSIGNSLASGDCGKRKGAVVQQTVQRFNQFKKLVENTAEVDSVVNGPGSIQKNKSDINLKSEDSSQKQIQNLSDAKMGLKDTNFISEDWKKTMEALQLRLTETLNQNNELKAVISSLQIKMQDEVAKCKEQSEKTLSELHNKDIEALKQLQADNIKQLEKSFQVKLDEAEKTYHHKVDKIKANYENKVKELKADREQGKKEKDKEISRLTEIIQQQCARMSNDIAALRNHIETSLSNNNEEKIVVLQKCVSKMEKLFQKSERDYQKQLEKLKQELELKDKVMQMQLKTQRAELIARNSTESQKQFDDIINSLEVKYIQMLEYHETQVMESKKQDDEKIERLLDILDKHDIPYDL